jgi:O-antigen/teichoic acid export membrane protein
MLARINKLAAVNKATASRTGAAIAERALLAVATFAMTVLLGRWGGKAELGQFAIFFPWVFVAIALQESLITAPYTVHAAGLTARRRRRYLGGVLIHTVVLGAASTAAFGAAAAVLYAFGDAESAVVCGVLAAATPAILLREFARRVVYADLRPHAAVWLSGGVSALQLAMMAALHLAGRLDAALAYAAMGGASAIGAGVWLALNRSSIEWSRTPVVASFKRNWILGRWIVPTQVGEIVRTQMFPALLAIAADKATAGAYAACAVVANLPTPLQNALSNILLPEFAQVERKAGVRAADRLMWQATGWLTAVMTAFLLVVVAFSGALVPLAYGDEFTGTAHPLVVLALATWLTGVSLPSARALLVLKRPDQVCWAHLAGILVNFAIAWPLIVSWGVVGAAYAALFGAALKAGLGGWWYLVEIRKQLSAEAEATASETSLRTAPEPQLGASRILAPAFAVQTSSVAARREEPR